MVILRGVHDGGRRNNCPAAWKCEFAFLADTWAVERHNSWATMKRIGNRSGATDESSDVIVLKEVVLIGWINLIGKLAAISLKLPLMVSKQTTGQNIVPIVFLL